MTVEPQSGTAEPFSSAEYFSQLLWMKTKYDYISLEDGYIE